MRLVIPPGVLRPPSDAYMLADQLRRELLHRGESVLDMCSGSGMLATAAAQSGARHVTAVDISLLAVLTTRLNAKLNDVHVRAVRGDLFAAVPGERFDVVVSNPPYLVSASDQLPRRGPSRAWDAGRSGRAFLDRICELAQHHLNPGGVLLLVHSSLCSEDATVESLAAQGYQVRIAARHRGPLGPRMRSRVTMLRRRGLLHQDAMEDVVVVRAQWPGEPAEAKVSLGRSAHKNVSEGGLRGSALPCS